MFYIICEIFKLLTTWKFAFIVVVFIIGTTSVFLNTNRLQFIKPRICVSRLVTILDIISSVTIVVTVIIITVVLFFLNFSYITFPPLKRYIIHSSTIGYTATYLKLCNGIFLLLYNIIAYKF